ncbi:DUF305 domain-containing protein [Kineococcus arenarius]|uniref:DUF305 domain-containing protein n=1 Tax=unclassified Kineococcus TaxID=2621656 RepID=UPI003D7ED788
MRTATRTTRTATRIGATGAAAALSLVLAACGGGDTGSMDHSSMSSESSTTSSSPPVSATSSAAVDAEHNDQDVVFAQMMIVHHQGALEMADTATTKASSQEVEDLAATIKAAQQPEIEQMTSWLAAWGEPTEADSSMEGMDHSATPPTGGSSMPGMMTEEQMPQLQNATGTDFDRLFLQMMIEHHTGAVRMAETEQQQGSNPQAQDLADSIVMTQNAEIEQMNQMLTTLG